jgi:hypothetical protein
MTTGTKIHCYVTSEQLEKFGTNWQDFSGSKKMIAEKALAEGLKGVMLKNITLEADDNLEFKTVQVTKNNPVVGGSTVEIQISINSENLTEYVRTLTDGVLNNLHSEGYHTNCEVNKQPSRGR